MCLGMVSPMEPAWKLKTRRNRGPMVPTTTPYLSGRAMELLPRSKTGNAAEEREEGREGLGQETTV